MEDNAIFNEEEMLKSYVGPNYDKFVNGGYSYQCLLFGWIYLFYRKFYKLSFLLLIINILTILVFYFLINYYVLVLLISLMFLFQFVIGLSFKKIYLKNANIYVEKLKNKNLSSEEIKNYCIKNGGIDKRVFLLMFIISLLTIIIYFVSNKILIKGQLIIHFPSELNNYLQNANENEYVKNGYNYSNTELDYDKEESKCIFTFNSNDEYTLNDDTNKEIIVKKYLNDIYGIDVNISKIEINNVELSYYYDKLNNTHFYIYVDNNKLNDIVINIKKDDNNKCSEFKNYIVNHLEYGY